MKKLKLTLLFLLLSISLAYAVQISIPYDGNAGSTIRVVGADTVQTLVTAGISLSSGENGIIGIFITCEDNDIRYAFNGIVPTQGLNGLGHILYSGQSLSLRNLDSITTLRFINKLNGVTANLQITPEYGF